MDLKTDSLITKLYLNFYGVNEDKLPYNGCTYFWLLLIAIVFAIPKLAFTLPYKIALYITNLFTKEDIVAEIKNDNIMNLGSELSLSTCLWALIFVYAIYPITEGWAGFIVVYGLTVVFALIGYAIYYFKEKSKSNFTTPIVEVVEITSERVKSFKERYCPKINWK